MKSIKPSKPDQTTSTSQHKQFIEWETNLKTKDASSNFARSMKIFEQAKIHVKEEALNQEISSNLRNNKQKEEKINPLLVNMQSIKNLSENKLKTFAEFEIKTKKSQEYFNELDTIRSQMINKIKKLDNDSSLVINKEKRFVEIQTEIQQNLAQQNLANRMEKQLEKINVNIDNKQTFEHDLQSLLSEIIDGIIFFESRPEFYNQKKQLGLQKDAKQKLSMIIKTLLVKIFNRQFIELSNKSAKIDFKNIRANETKIEAMRIMFPEIKSKFKTESDHQQQIDDWEQITEILKNLLSYLWRISNSDTEISSILNEVFDNYQIFYRNTAHDNLVYNLEKTCGQVLQSNEKYPFLFDFCIEIAFIEYFYYLFLFKFDERLEKEKVSFHVDNILTKQYNLMKSLAKQEIGLPNIYFFIDLINDKSKQIDLFENLPMKSIMVSLLDMFTPNLLNYFKTSFTKIVNKFFGKLKEDLMQILVHFIQQQIHEKITSFDLEAYFKSKPLCFRRLSQENLKITGYDFGAREDTFPPIIATVSLVKELKIRMKFSIFVQICQESFSSAMNLLQTAADSYEEKSDSLFFLLKHLYILNDSLADIENEFIFKEQELDFTSTKNTIYDLFAGKLERKEPNKTYWEQALELIDKGMPKINEFTIDIKNNIKQQIERIETRFVKDFSFIIGKTLTDFMQRNEYLQTLLKNEAKSKEKIEEELKMLLSRENIKKSYLIFRESLFATFEDIKWKMNFYFKKGLFLKIEIPSNQLLENMISLLRNFQIIVSKIYINAEYNEFQFQVIEEIRREIKGKLEFIE